MLDTFRLIFDFGVLVLIWLVQLVIYPSFKYHFTGTLREWHPRYTFLVSFVVMPLMFGQLGIALYQLYLQPNFFSISTIILILVAWLLTFFQAVPLHASLGTTESPLPLIERLIFVNGIRTAAWTLAFVISLVYFIQSH